MSMDRYEEAMSRCKQWEREHTKGYVIQDMIEFIFPELANEDEKIKRAISYAIAQVKHEDGILIDRITEDMALAWLEKQKEQSFTHHEIDESLRDAVTHQMEDDGDVDDFVRKGIDDIALKYAMIGAEWQKEQKPAEWSEEDEKKLRTVISLMRASRAVDPFYDKMCLEGWLKSLPERFNLPPKQEWSEEDEQWLEAIVKDYEDSLTKDKDHAAVIKIKIDFLNSLRPRPRWKPSEEQMDALKNSAYGTYQNGDGPALRELYEQLKKL